MKKYDVQKLRVIKIENNYNAHYLICMCNRKRNEYTEIFTNEKVIISDENNIKPLSDYYLYQTNDENNKQLFLYKNELLKIYIDINNEYILEQCEEIEDTKENKFLDINTELEKATLNFFPKEGGWSSNCFKRPSDLIMKNLPCHLRDEIWLAKMLKRNQNLFYISFDKILNFVKNSSFFEQKRHEYELEIVKWQIKYIENRGEGWIVDDEYGGDFVYMSSVCDLGVRKGVVDTLSKIGMSKDVIEEGLEKNSDLWRNYFMEKAFLNQYEPIFLNFGRYSTYQNYNKKIELPKSDPEHQANWLKMRKYEYYKRHKESVDKYGTLEPEMIMTDEEVEKLKIYLEQKHTERMECIQKYRDARFQTSSNKQKIIKN